jgi:hypothetical protein
MTVATALAVSWKPFTNSKPRAMRSAMRSKMKGSQLSVMTPASHLEIDIQPGIDDAGNQDAHEKDGGCRRDRMVELGLYASKDGTALRLMEICSAKPSDD